MKYAIWIVQILLALAFIASGSMKLMTPVADLAQQMSWVSAVPAWSIPVIGILEAAGGLGLLLPWLTGIQPQLVRLAALGLMFVMIGAFVTHIAIGDAFGMVIPSIVLGLLAAFLAYARTSLLPLGR